MTLRIRDVVRILNQHGFIQTRVSGSHARYSKHTPEGTKHTTLVVKYLGADVGPGTLKKIFRETGVPIQF